MTTKMGKPPQAPQPLVIIKREQQKRYRRSKQAKRSRSKDREELVRGVCGKRLLPLDDSSRVKYQKADRMGLLYADMYARYYRTQYPMNIRRKMEENKSITGCLFRAVAQAEMVDASYQDYLEAQFHWIDDYKQEAPTFSQLASMWAVRRYTWWKKMKDEGDEPAFSVHPGACDHIDPAGTDTAFIMAYDSRLLTRMVKDIGSEEEVWELCGDPVDDEVFSLVFKQTREVWRKMYQK